MRVIMQHIDFSFEEVVVDQLRLLGYRHSFELEGGGLYCPEADQRFGWSELHLEAAYRFAEGSRLGSALELMALRTDDGTKGLLFERTFSFLPSASERICGKIDDARSRAEIMEFIPANREIVIISRKSD